MRTRSKWLVVLGGAVLFVLATLTGLFAPLSDFARKGLLPVVRAVSSATGYAVDSMDRKSALEQRVEELEARQAKLHIDYVRLKALEEENKSLRAQAGFLDESGFDSVGALVISRDVKGIRAHVLIDRGRADHVEIGQAVIADGGIFIGKVKELYDSTAVVELVTDTRSRVSGALVGKRDLIGVIEGRGNGTAVLTYIPNDAGTKKDDVIVTAGTEEKVPPNLLIGLVNELEGETTDPFLSASIEPFVDLDQIQHVSILRPSALRPQL